ncbi:MAG: polysaccharide deacetylase family protein [Candidatus Geothermincolia bacterium]
MKNNDRCRYRCRLAAPLLIACAILLLGTAPLGWAATDASIMPNPFKTIAGSINKAMGFPDGGVIVGDRMITYKEGSLQGVLPSVKPELITRGNPDLKRVALTIDDGWNPDPRILKMLKQKNIKFTAFLIGGRGVADAQPQFVKQIADAGGEVCSHTLSHYVMTGKPESFVMTELWAGQGAITQVTHEVLPYVRFSGGAYDKTALNWSGREGYYVVNWTLDTRDSAPNPTVDGEVAAVMGGLSNGAIILCHFGGHNTYEVLARIIPEIQNKGYEITNLSGVFEGTPYKLKGTTSSKGKNTGN